MIQGGDPTGNGAGGESLWGGTFADEFDPSLKMERGVIAMANRGPNTNGSQFFIVVRKDGCPRLNGHHTIFGRVVAGIEVAEAISAAKTEQDRPVEPVTFRALVENPGWSSTTETSSGQSKPPAASAKPSDSPAGKTPAKTDRDADEDARMRRERYEEFQKNHPVRRRVVPKSGVDRTDPVTAPAPKP